MKIQTGRLELRLYRDEDFEFLYSMLSDPDVVRYIGNGQTRSREGAMEFLYWIYRSYKENPDLGLRVLVRKSDGQAVGHAGLVKQIVEGKPELEIGYWIAKEFWGQGYAKEAANALRYYGIHYLAKIRFISLIQPGNSASRKVAEYIGMSLEKEIVMNGKDVYVYALNVQKSQKG